MKRLYPVLILIFFSVLAINCQKEVSKGFDPDPNNNNPNVVAPVTAHLQGNVIDENGMPAQGVSVKVGTKTAMTDARGYFRINNAGLDKNASLVVAEKAGYFKALRSFKATSGTNQVAIQLIKKSLTGTVSATAGGSITLSNGSKITLPANGIVKASGSAAYTGTVNVYSSYIDPTDTRINQLVPGSFMANDKDGKRVTLASYGMLAVELESTTGEKLQIAPGSKATLITAIPTTLQAAAPASIPLWYVDETTGLWKEEGSATKNGSTYVGDVKHFSFWNCDAPFPTVNFTATVKTSDGLPVVHTTVTITMQTGNSYWTAYGITDSAGQVSGLIPANSNLALKIMGSGCNDVIYTQNIGPFSSSANLGTIVVPSNTPSLLTLKGKLLNCSNAPVTNGSVLVRFDNWTRYVQVSSNGEFLTSYILCGGIPASFQIIGFDNAASQQGPAINVTATAPLTDAGNIAACGTSSLQYFNYDLDGVSTALNNSDSLVVYTSPVQVPGTYSQTTYINGSRNNNWVSARFDNNNTAGIYPLNNLTIDGYNRIGLIAPFNVTVTSMPTAIGEYIEGSLSGQFRDSANLAPLHTINATFRIRKTW